MTNFKNDCLEQISKKNIEKIDHTENGLSILNYTRDCQFSKDWNYVTLQSRGLVIDQDFKVVARPFPKFFNVEEIGEKNLPNDEPLVFEKLDGSCGIGFCYNGVQYLNTRGSWNSDQAVIGLKLLQENGLIFLEGWTYMFEIIAESIDKKVVNYGGVDKLVLLAIIETATGGELEYSELPKYANGLEIVKLYNFPKFNVQNLKDLNTDNSEGFVCVYRNGFRSKIKFIDYCRKHKTKANLTEKFILEFWQEDKVSELLQVVEDEFDLWVVDVLKSFDKQLSEMEEYVANFLANIPKNSTIVDVVNMTKNSKFQYVILRMFKGQEPNKRKSLKRLVIPIGIKFYTK